MSEKPDLEMIRFIMMEAWIKVMDINVDIEDENIKAAAYLTSAVFYPLTRENPSL